MYGGIDIVTACQAALLCLTCFAVRKREWPRVLEFVAVALWFIGCVMLAQYYKDYTPAFAELILVGLIVCPLAIYADRIAETNQRIKLAPLLILSMVSNVAYWYSARIGFDFSTSYQLLGGMLFAMALVIVSTPRNGWNKNVFTRAKYS